MNFLQNKKLNTMSTASKYILDYRYLLTKRLIWTLGHIKSIKCWYYKWMEDSPLVDKINPNLSQHMRRMSKFSILLFTEDIRTPIPLSILFRTSR